MLDRRHFLATVASGVAASLSLRGNLLAQIEKTPPLPDRSLFDKNEDAYWAEMRKQFLIPEDEIYLNNGTVGSSPAPVLRAIFDGYTTTEKMDQEDPEDYPIWEYAAWNEFRDPLAAFVGCTRDEIALLRNATEANSYIANGVDLKPGDEVLMTDQEHPGGQHPWDLKAKRYGIVIKKVTLPRPVKDAAQVLNLFNDAITPRTRVIFFSHITTFSGVVLPAKELCALAKSKGILSAVDGAHVPACCGSTCTISDATCIRPARTSGCRRPRARVSVRARRSHRPRVVHHRHRRLGRHQDSAPNVFNASAVRTCRRCGGCAPRSNWRMTLEWTGSNIAIASLQITFSMK